ncbi:hypothetical protein [Wukongibacter sp. M2B1]|uniref:hypothetical protein n=1 Tax=Wukongibacter sp. M2B1 TaxID=3088895 RepID=UPI003D7A4B2E
MRNILIMVIIAIVIFLSNGFEANALNNIQEGSTSQIQVEFTWEDEKIKAAAAYGFPSVYEEVSRVDYQPKDTDILQYDSNLSGISLFKSIKYFEFNNIVIKYNHKKIEWSEMFDGLDYFDMEKSLTVSLKKDNIYEEEVIDEFVKNYRYYRADHGICYEVSEVSLGSTIEEAKTAKKRRTGICCYIDAIESTDNQGYKSIYLSKNESLIDCQITELNSNPVMYLEKLSRNNGDKKLIKEWVSIKDGVSLQKYIFSSEGLPEVIRTASSIIYQELDDSIFIEPDDVEFKDITTFLYAFLDDGFSDIEKGLKNTLLKEPFSLILTGRNGEKMTIYTQGDSDGDTLGQIAIVRAVHDSKKEEIELIGFYDGEYYNTVIPSKKIVERYSSSYEHLKLFDFKNTGFREKKDLGETIIYTFEDLGKGSVSGLRRFYEYEIDKENMKLIKISIYNKEFFKDSEIIGDKNEYILSELMKGNMEIFKIPDDYKIYTNRMGEHNDGEHYPIWWK